MNLPPVLRQRYFDANGNPLSGGKLYTYQAGTTTPQATYTDVGGATPNPNPIVLDAQGYATMWLDPSLSYKFILKSAADVTLWTIDDVAGFLGPESIVTAALQDGAVTTQKLANNAVTSVKLASSASVDGDRAVTTNHIRNGAVTREKQAAVNKLFSANTSIWSEDGVGGTTYQDVTISGSALSITITTTGRPVFIGLVPALELGIAGFTAKDKGASSAALDARLQIVRDSTAISQHTLAPGFPSAHANNKFTVPPGAVWVIDEPSAGTYTYKLQWLGSTATEIQLFDSKMVAYEL